MLWTELAAEPRSPATFASLCNLRQTRQTDRHTNRRTDRQIDHEPCQLSSPNTHSCLFTQISPCHSSDLPAKSPPLRHHDQHDWYPHQAPERSSGTPLEPTLWRHDLTSELGPRHHTRDHLWTDLPRQTARRCAKKPCASASEELTWYSRGQHERATERYHRDSARRSRVPSGPSLHKRITRAVLHRP